MNIKSIACGLAACAAMALIAGTTTYDDLNGQTSTNEQFWNLANHPQVTVCQESDTINAPLDTWYKTEAWKDAELRLGQCGLMITIR